MTLKENIERELARSVHGSARQGDLKVILGEIQRLPSKNPSDEDVTRILKILRKNGKEILKALESSVRNNIIDSSDKSLSRAKHYIQNINDFLPEEIILMNEDEVENWIHKKIDLTSFKNKMAAIKPILNMLDGKVDGETVRKVIVERF